MLSRRLLLFLLVLLAMFGASACDYGMHFVPESWEKIGPHTFRKSFGLIEIEMDRFGGLIGARSILSYILVRNKGDDLVTIKKMVLVAGDDRYDWDTSYNTEFTVKPNEVHDLTATWNYSGDKYLSKAFRPAEIHIEALVGDRPTTIVILLAQT